MKPKIPDHVNEIIAKSDISEMIADFREKDFSVAAGLMLLSVDDRGNVTVRSTLDILTSLGVLAVAAHILTTDTERDDEDEG
jgi:hypothetical protein